MTVAPDAKPTKKPTSRLIRLPVAPPTAASASLPTNRPTIIASAVLYSCWKKVPNRIGKKNASSCFQITPSVMLVSRSRLERCLMNMCFPAPLVSRTSWMYITHTSSFVHRLPEKSCRTAWLSGKFLPSVIFSFTQLPKKVIIQPKHKRYCVERERRRAS